MRKAIEIKSEVVSEIVEKLQKSSAAVVVDYKGLTVEEVTELRKQMREAGVDYKVYKNTLVRRAAKEVGIEQFNDELLVGTNAIAFGYDDPVAPARILKGFMDSHPKMKLKMGIVEGAFYDESKIVEMANIPSREVLIAKLLGSLKAPVSNFAYLIDAIAKKAEGQEEA
ncbi:TPA: 50S ribosomal protein L10 [Clostridioides difficile]|uniref:Large ribosomal subunit protein uL10 n=6 Tax=Clostridioides difficile TaxID=1496 RepID=RL10_CLOD6|nr:50S ribosomal protein L10 [Clostridioides difficile]Q18CE8.1 RecName: Full=Large ribosomal subunit protein uL10; AltName: Full=50S ribosomal protein L10 [Clostridioides difficile 630]EQF29479.1 50S ribosomal protein L10 [Clostridioides difficile CD160]EQG78981.1 50S ribosomal protein L10 [Clostridioides difficile DA00165]MCC0629567.1 50S ribosomal protein L10 [Clostridioides sp. ES-S-0171-01]MCC0688599.1 50S ribosomal protein L10 [Clostridioides sp. ES-S-0056-01]MCC0693799.1 50S ribosomal 